MRFAAASRSEGPRPSGLRGIPRRAWSRSAPAALLAAALSVSTLGGAPTASATDVEDARAQAEDAIRDLDAAQAQLGELDQRIASVEHRQEVASAGLEQLQLEAQAIAVDQYMQAGDPPPLVPVERGASDQLFGNELARMVAEGDTDAVARYAARHDDLAAAAAELDDLRAEQAQVVDDLAARNQQLQEDLSRLEELERDRIAAEQARMEAERQRREAALQAQADAPEDTSDGSAPPPAGGDTTDPTAPPSDGPTAAPSDAFLCPVPGSTFIDSWGAPRSGGRRHEGVDMMAQAGTPIYASVDGDVSHRGVSLGGLSFFLYGDDGNTYFGTHLSAYGAAGHVVAGTVIGYVGSSGNANGINHLHFEIWPGGGEPVNPYPTVAAAC